MAKRRIENDKPLFNGSLTPDERSVLPNNFDLRRLREARVCNVVVSLYNRSADPALTARFDRALELLRKHC